MFRAYWSLPFYENRFDLFTFQLETLLLKTEPGSISNKNTASAFGIWEMVETLGVTERRNFALTTQNCSQVFICLQINYTWLIVKEPQFSEKLWKDDLTIGYRVIVKVDFHSVLGCQKESSRCDNLFEEFQKSLGCSSMLSMFSEF